MQDRDSVITFEEAKERLGIKPMTNEEYLKSLNTEQLAEWLGNTFDLCGAGCSKCFIKEFCFDEHNNKMPTELFVEWLKEIHK